MPNSRFTSKCKSCSEEYPSQSKPAPSMNFTIGVISYPWCFSGFGPTNKQFENNRHANICDRLSVLEMRSTRVLFSPHLGRLNSPQSDPLPCPIHFCASPPDERLVRIGLAEGESGGLVTGLGAPTPLRGASRGSEPSARWYEASYR